MIEETNDFYKLQISSLEKLLTKTSSELQSSLDRELKSQRQLQTTTHNFSLQEQEFLHQDQEYLQVIKSQKSDFQSLQKKYINLEQINLSRTQDHYSALGAHAKQSIREEVKILAKAQHKQDLNGKIFWELAFVLLGRMKFWLRICRLFRNCKNPANKFSLRI